MQITNHFLTFNRDKLDDDTAYLDVVETSQHNTWTVKLGIGSANCEAIFKIDTGAEVTVISDLEAVQKFEIVSITEAKQSTERTRPTWVFTKPGLWTGLDSVHCFLCDFKLSRYHGICNKCLRCETCSCIHADWQRLL